MKRFAVAALCTLVLVGFVMAEEFNLQISKINDDGSVTGTKQATPAKGKGGKGGGGFGGFGKGEEVTVKLASGVKVYKGKFDTDSKAFVKDGDDLGLVGLKSAFKDVDKVSVTVGGNALTDKDTLELTVKDGKTAAKINGKEIDINTVKFSGKTPLFTRVTTNDDGTANTVLITGAGGGFGKGKKGGGN
jgi:hypothetical protein